jgi:hypothetical protein
MLIVTINSSNRAGGYICCLVKVHDVIIRIKNAVHQFQLILRVANYNYLFKKRVTTKCSHSNSLSNHWLHQKTSLISGYFKNNLCTTPPPSVDSCIANCWPFLPSTKMNICICFRSKSTLCKFSSRKLFLIFTDSLTFYCSTFFLFYFNFCWDA